MNDMTLLEVFDDFIAEGKHFSDFDVLFLKFRFWQFWDFVELLNDIWFEKTSLENFVASYQTFDKCESQLKNV